MKYPERLSNSQLIHLHDTYLLHLDRGRLVTDTISALAELIERRGADQGEQSVEAFKATIEQVSQSVQDAVRKQPHMSDQVEAMTEYSNDERW